VRVRLSADAENDLTSVREYIGQANRAAAKQITIELVQAAKSLALFPNRGRPGVIAGTRELVSVRPYIITYRV
jgi:plasmid stabilization system protein ParE